MTTKIAAKSNRKMKKEVFVILPLIVYETRNNSFFLVLDVWKVDWGKAMLLNLF